MKTDANPKNRGPLGSTGLPSLVGYQLRCAQSIAIQTFTELFAAENIAYGQYSTFVVISRSEGTNQKALARALRLDQSTLIPTLDHLERNGWIARTRDPQDRRSTLLTVTTAGKAKLRRLEALIRKHDAALTRSLSAAETSSLLNMLHRIVASFDRSSS
jgi:DNA-binding MarR family transcriptional regulator